MTGLGPMIWQQASMQVLPAGHAYTVPENLFRKITDEERADWQQRFAGIRT
jgi:methionyl-tRNA synthetase